MSDRPLSIPSNSSRDSAISGIQKQSNGNLPQAEECLKIGDRVKSQTRFIGKTGTVRSFSKFAEVQFVMVAFPFGDNAIEYPHPLTDLIKE
jgi:hypothetical protein